MEVLDLRHFSSSELRPLLEEETRVWSRLLAWDYRSSAEMILRYVDAKILPGYAVSVKGSILGYAFFVYEGNKGVVGDLFVSEESRHAAELDINQAESTLLAHVIETLQQSPGIHRVEAQLLAHDSGSVSQPFLTQRFRQHPRLFMVLPLNSPKVGSNGRLPSEIELRAWNESDYQSVATVITAAYHDHVDAEINDQYRSVAGALRFLNNIVRFPGCGTFDANSSFVAVHRATGAVIGTILCSRVKEDVGHVTQVCLVPQYRGVGIGEAMLNATSDNLASRGFSLLTLTVTEANASAVSVYKKLGYEANRVFDAFVWEG